MFGANIDYWLLKPFTHTRNRRTEADLNAAATDVPFSLADAQARLEKLRSRLQGHLPVSPHLRYLDIGCGQGDLPIALAVAGCRSVDAIDHVPRTITQARHHAALAGVTDRVNFICEDISKWTAPHRYDVVLSHEALEHIDAPDAFLAKLAELVAPGGCAVLAFGPLFHSACGDHMDGFFRCEIPWRGALFSEAAILRLRRECFRPTDTAASYRFISGGLNQLRYSEFLRDVRRLGWRFVFLRVNPQLARLPGLERLSAALTTVPVLRDYIACSVYAVLRYNGNGTPVPE